MKKGFSVGLLGGSFNPAHGGHRRMSVTALERLGLDEVWWLVSPQNPLKPVAGMAPLALRIASGKAAARHPRIRVTGIEAELGTQLTIDTIEADSVMGMAMESRRFKIAPEASGVSVPGVRGRWRK